MFEFVNLEEAVELSGLLAHNQVCLIGGRIHVYNAFKKEFSVQKTPKFKKEDKAFKRSRRERISEKYNNIYGGL